MIERNMETMFKHSPYIPFDPDCWTYVLSEGSPLMPPLAVGLGPFEFTNWWNECMSWHETAYIHAELNPAATYKFKGPDALKFLKSICVNSFDNYPIGKGKHGIMCNEDGLDMQDGICLRTGEDEFLTFWMWPYIEYALLKSNMNVEGENLTGKVFMYQIAGPKSLEIIEEAAKEDLHDIKFIHFRDSVIAGKKVMILRAGMTGNLAYEVHGDFEDCIPVYNALLEAGEKFGIRKLGRHGYRNTHTEGGFPQLTIHHLSGPDPEFGKYAGACSGCNNDGSLKLTGSCGDDISVFWRTPYDLGWGGMVKFDHDYIGRAALEKIAKNPPRTMVTLEWNDEDILDIYSSYFKQEEPYQLFEFPEDWSYQAGSLDMHADQVLFGGKRVGVSSGRIFSPYWRKMLSLCTIDIELSKEGTDVVILYGDPDKRQKEIRAKVSRFPYNHIDRNEHFDVSSIPKKY